MHLKGKEKYFWRSINYPNLAAIPLEKDGFKAIDDEVDDQIMFYVTSRIPTIHHLYFKFTHITDEGVKYISNIKELWELTLRDHKNITKESIPYLNKLVDLVYLDILKTKICLEDLPDLYNLQKLRELYVSSENIEIEYVLGHVIKMKEILPNCILYINYESYE